jgi:hypothetical protein
MTWVNMKLAPSFTHEPSYSSISRAASHLLSDILVIADSWDTYMDFVDRCRHLVTGVYRTHIVSRGRILHFTIFTPSSCL